MPLGGGLMRSIAAHGEQTTVNLGMQRLQATIHHLREARMLGDVLDGNGRSLEGASAAAGGEEFHAERGKPAGKIEETAFVGNRKQRPLDPSGRCCHKTSFPIALGGVGPLQPCLDEARLAWNRHWQ